MAHVRDLTRREFLERASAYGATLAWAGQARPRPRAWTERRDLFTEGVASGDPDASSVLLWTRASFATTDAVRLTLEIAEESSFARVVATSTALARRENDYTCRVLAAGLRPGRTYWFRFADDDGRGTRVGRTRTAPRPTDAEPVRFAFVSCQNICEGAQHAYRRMIAEDTRAAADAQLAFVLHLGDFIYEVVDYPEERPNGRRYDRRLRDAVRLPDGERISPTTHVAASLADYRTLYRAYLRDPDIQDARARWPFVVIWDNHEFSWMGWQTQRRFGGVSRPAQPLKVAANQAWFEYQPARVTNNGRTSVEQFVAPPVATAPVTFDAEGLADDPDSRAAVQSLSVYRRLQWGRHLDLLITDLFSYRSEEPTTHPDARIFSAPDYPEFFPEEVLEALDAGRTHNQGRPTDELRFGDKRVANFRRDSPAQSVLGAKQKAWFLDALRSSRATWKVWACSNGPLDWRADPQNVRVSGVAPWPGRGFAGFGGGDFSTAYKERADIYDTVKNSGITGFVTVSGDRHSFWAGYASKSLPPSAFEPVGVSFITGSVSAPGLVEALEHALPRDLALRALYLVDAPDGRSEATVNLLLRHGVESCIEYSKHRDIAAAWARTNAALAPHLAFVDMGGHGYATVTLTRDLCRCEFVCIPRPLERIEERDGPPVRYRVVHECDRWTRGSRPRLRQRVIEGDPGLGL